MNWKKILTIIASIIIMISGVYALMTPTETFMGVAGYLVGVMILFDAIANISIWAEAKKYVEVSGWYLASAILSLIFGIVIIVSMSMQLAIDFIIIYMVAVWIIIMGILRIALAVRMKQYMDKIPVFKNNRWIIVLCLGILMVLFGIVCICNPVILSTMLGILIGLMLLVIGSSLLTIGMYAY